VKILKDKTFFPARNSDNVKHLFYARNEYALKSLASVDPNKRNRIVDTINIRDLYGKINMQGKPVFILNSGLKQITTPSGVVFAANFAADAFKDMIDDYIYLSTRREIFPSFGGSLNKLEAKRGWIDAEVEYFNHMTNMKNFFIEEYLSKTKRKIISFLDVIEEFKFFVRDHAARFPMSLSTFIMSDYCPPNISGLQIDMSEDDKGDDFNKKLVIDNRNFNNLITLASKYGFYIDKNSPTTLVADLGSPRMQTYMRAYAVDDPKRYFDEYCVKAFINDIQGLKDFLYDCYYAYFKSKPYYRVRKICKNTGRLKTSQMPRYVTDKEGIENLTGDAWWDSLYFFVRQTEIGIKVEPNVKREVMNQVRVIRGLMPKSKLSQYYSEYITGTGAISAENDQDIQSEIIELQNTYNDNLGNYIKNQNTALSIIDNFFLDRDPRLRKLLEGLQGKALEESKQPVYKNPTFQEVSDALARDKGVDNPESDY
tara:strand:+ start:1605 stop:3053 length:1449 start_codon:yes stop_codon:yes gene_type:complete